MKGKIIKTDNKWYVEIQSDLHGYGIGWGDSKVYPLLITDENIWEGKEVEVEPVHWDSNFIPVIVKIKDNAKGSQCFIDNDMSDYVGFINFLRRETGMSKTSTLIALEYCRGQVAEILKDWYRAHGKKTSTLKNEDGKPFVNTMPMIETNVGNDGFEFDHNSTIPPIDGLCDTKSIYGERELTVDERMHLWFVDKKPNRDVCDSVDELSDEEKHKYFDGCNITRTIQIDIPTIINK